MRGKAKTPDFHPLAPDVVVDHFRLTARVGFGASGEVWRAHDSQRQVAIKFMNTALLTGEDAPRHLLRFQNEIRVLKKLIDLPNVPTLYGYNLHYERPYLVMEYIEAPAWSSLIASGEMMLLTLEQRLDLLETIAHAITDIHRHGIIHRDIKPANIHNTSHPYIIDFSVAIEKKYAYEAEPNVGTGLYMPPPDDRPPDEKTDNFAFALVAYEMLFGQHAIFKPETLNAAFPTIRQLMQTHLQNGDWHKPSCLTPAELPGSLRGADLAQLDAIFTRALSRRTSRYTNLQQFIKDIRGAVLTPANQPYLEYVPDLPNISPPPQGSDYTRHQVRRAHQNTQHFPVVSAGLRTNWVRLSITFLVVLWLAAVITVFLFVSLKPA